MRKAFVKTSLLSTLMLATGAAMAAAPTSDLLVNGKIAVPGCTVAQSGGGVYDYGSISPGLIKPGTATTPLAPETQTWTVTCDADTFLSFQVIDNQAASSSAPSATNFGLGNINSTGKIGYYNVVLSNPRVDAATAYVYSAAAGSTSVTGAATATVNSSLFQGWASASGASSAQRVGKVFAVDMKVQPYLAGSTTMGGAVTTAVPLNGSLTVNYTFGL